MRRRLLEEHNLEIGAGLGALAGKAWRIGLMGSGCHATNVYRCLGALAAVLGRTERIRWQRLRQCSRAPSHRSRSLG